MGCGWDHGNPKSFSEQGAGDNLRGPRGSLTGLGLGARALVGLSSLGFKFL